MIPRPRTVSLRARPVFSAKSNKSAPPKPLAFWRDPYLRTSLPGLPAPQARSLIPCPTPSPKPPRADRFPDRQSGNLGQYASAGTSNVRRRVRSFRPAGPSNGPHRSEQVFGQAKGNHQAVAAAERVRVPAAAFSSAVTIACCNSDVLNTGFISSSSPPFCHDRHARS